MGILRQLSGRLRRIEAAEDDKKASYDGKVHKDCTGDACDYKCSTVNPLIGWRIALQMPNGDVENACAEQKSQRQSAFVCPQCELHLPALVLPFPVRNECPVEDGK
jgi:hypothetical protein